MGSVIAGVGSLILPSDDLWVPGQKRFFPMYPRGKKTEVREFRGWPDWHLDVLPKYTYVDRSGMRRWKVDNKICSFSRQSEYVNVQGELLMADGRRVADNYC